MSRIYQRFLKPLLFRSEPETIHHRTLSGLSFIARSPALCQLVQEFLSPPRLPTEAMGIKFPNPIGLAAGMDKNGVAIDAWAALGFGFTEIGGVTQHPQPGNPRPRLFRIPETNAIINRMGFNNDGAKAIATRLSNTKKQSVTPLGINLGKSKRTPLEEAHLDFVHSFLQLHAYADFFVVNVSSPNTPGLRKLQDKESLATILRALKQANHEPAQLRPKPILVKIAPDLTFEAIDDVIELVSELNLDGIVATNTTLSRPEDSKHHSPKTYEETGGLSGKPLQKKSTEIIRHIHQQTNGKLTIIGVGGIDDAASAWEKITSGAALLQIYSGLIFQGPEMLPTLLRDLIQQLDVHRCTSFTEAVGAQLPFVEKRKA